MFFSFFFFNDTATTEIYTLSLHDALPILIGREPEARIHSAELREENQRDEHKEHDRPRSEEHTSELQSPCNLVCRLLLEKKKLWPGPTGGVVRPKCWFTTDNNIKAGVG